MSYGLASLYMAKWRDAEGEWTQVPEMAQELATYLMAHKNEKPWASKAALARHLGVAGSQLINCERSDQFMQYLNHRRELEGLDRDSKIERAKEMLWQAGQDGDTKALEQFLRMEGQFAPEKHEVTYRDSRDMTTEEIEEELQRIMATEKKKAESE